MKALVANLVAQRALPTTGKIGWRPKEWAAAVGLSRAAVYQLLANGTLKSVHHGKARIITTSPSEYLASLTAA